MNAATTAAAMAAMSASSLTLVGGAQVGRALGDANDSALSGLLVAGERALLAAAGESGAALFSDARVIVAEQAGILSKRLTVKAFRRRDILAYAIDPDTMVSLTLYGAFGQAVLVFDAGFDPMQLSQWLGETLAPPESFLED